MRWRSCHGIERIGSSIPPSEHLPGHLNPHTPPLINELIIANLQLKKAASPWISSRRKIRGAWTIEHSRTSERGSINRTRVRCKLFEEKMFFSIPVLIQVVSYLRGRKRSRHRRHRFWHESVPRGIWMVKKQTMLTWQCSEHVHRTRNGQKMQTSNNEPGRNKRTVHIRINCQYCSWTNIEVSKKVFTRK